MALKAGNNLKFKENPKGFKGGSLLAAEHARFWILWVSFVALQLATLTRFPKVHDDEGILSNFAYHLLQGGLPIVDPSQSHLGYLKGITVGPLSGILFYGSLALLGKSLGFGLYAMRLQPLAFAALSLVLVYAIGLRLFQDRTKAFLAAFFLATSTKFLVTAHLVRQESMWIALLLACFLLFLRGTDEDEAASLYTAAFLSGLAVCVHPNGILMPLLFGALWLWRRDRSRPFPARSAALMILFVASGFLVFFAFDYWPARDHFWTFFQSPLLQGFTHRYQSLFSSFGHTAADLLASLWADFWEPRYHRGLFAFGLYLAAFAGAVKFRTKAHTLLALTAFLIFLMLLPLHINAFYYAYFVPFLSLLLASVLKDAWDRPIALARPAARAAVGISLLLPLATLWSFRGYDFGSVARGIASGTGGGGAVLGSHAFFFGIPPERLYSRYTLIHYDLRTLMEEIPASYFILDRFTAPFVDKTNTDEPYAPQNADFLFKQCREERALNDYEPSLRGSANKSEKIALFDCRQALARVP